MVSEHDLDAAINAFRDALRSYVRGNPVPAMSFFSVRDDVTLANPLGPPARGPSAVADAGVRGADSFREGGELRFADVSTTFEEVSRYATSDLGYVVQIERHEGRLAARDDSIVIALRVTLIFRREDDAWKIVHRHADPITTPRSVSTAVQGRSSEGA
jgi:ketosteroid isomerase-like protein